MYLYSVYLGIDARLASFNVWSLCADSHRMSNISSSLPASCALRARLVRSTMALHLVKLRGRILLRSCMGLSNALNAFLDRPIVHVNLSPFDYMYASYMLIST
jgi:hypothetical protein